ncbi:MAG: hypothetical protein A2406_01905 [Candidatus Komeilibacteria bacterium RIFOXYC1_FULL_37_11]|uniref:O-antigen ligase-related domain-containing protein n=1 Tax=Candidatus Komeilibacteria bacterium RIFOXYC1_FULL_37_11 TaxID=1798555 RepID=A0A1G2BZ74_9BACT|nr:MAG: hypothetical protein A2406_01905 [Candidatus Komeilibacteria bacterium RIFOXYC1_FULL_37_11]OGY95376.1 MAG: hypothetical protein A2611_01610 [Candidatus Komeilibacteria bacterium RIFOXYD1_FULL_37_29]
MNNNIDRYINKFLKLIIPIIFLLPFIVSSDYYFPYITPRNFLFRIIVTIILALYLYLFFRNKEKYGFGKNKVILAYFFLAIILTMASILGGDFLYSFWSNYERMDGLVTLYYIIALFLVILGIYRHQKSWLNLLRLSVWAAFIMGIIALAQHWDINILLESSGGDRVTGTLGNATYLAVYSLFNLFFALYLLFKYKNHRPKLELWAFYILDIFLIISEIVNPGRGFLGGIFSDVRLVLLFIIPQVFINLQYYFYNIGQTIRYSWPAYFILIILLNFIALFNTQTRGVLVGLFIAGVVVAIFLLFSHYVSKKVKYFIVVGLTLFILFTGSIFVFKDSDFIQNNSTLRRVANISITDATTETRLLTWQLSLRGFTERPILGWGVENFYLVFNKYFPNQIFKDAGSRVWFDRPHNVFLQYLVDGGILGLLAYLAIFIFALRNFWKHYKKTHDPVTISIFGGLLIAYLVQNFFVFDSLNSYILLVVFLAVSIFLAGDFETNKKWLTSKYLAIPLALLVLIFGFYLNIPQLQTNRQFITRYTDLQKDIAQGQYRRADLDKLLVVIDQQYLGKFELAQVYSEFVPNLVRAQILSPIETKYFIDTAEEKMLQNIKAQPKNVRHHSFLTNLYFNAAMLDPVYAQKGIDLIENQALVLSPTRVQLYYGLGQFYINLGENEQAMANFIKAKGLAPRVFDSYYNLIMASLAMEDLDLANAYFEEMKQNVSVIIKENYLSLFMLYDYFGYKDQAAKLQQ